MKPYFKTYQLWLAFFGLIGISLTVKGWATSYFIVGDFKYAIWIGYGFWILFSAAIFIEGWLVARFLSKVAEKTIPHLPIASLFGLIAFGVIGFNAIAIWWLFLLSFAIFTIVFLSISVFESLGNRLVD